MAIVYLAALVVGAYDGFYGPGTGTFLLLIFCNLGKLDVRTAGGNAPFAMCKWLSDAHMPDVYLAFDFG